MGNIDAGRCHNYCRSKHTKDAPAEGLPDSRQAHQEPPTVTRQRLKRNVSLHRISHATPWWLTHFSLIWCEGEIVSTSTWTIT